ncbi:tubby-like F-box protein 6 [Phtheirospermum japonicum]|uniref:Tubby-like F-box protein n=1 Tax=Phtheirospermum japonicum TaxID=374723 RepID=A0A830B9G1_9LAMI|nr:tubby-like F-box protein 6 [Phtheirospermum japonicum]
MFKFGLKSRSRRVVQDSSVAVEKSRNLMGKNKKIDADENCSYCCWASLPSELLREVLSKLEESESKWPARKHVVACAGVCKSWREAMKEVVKTPEVSGKITFPLSVKQPGPRESLIQCFIKRNRATQSYYLFVNLSQALADDGKFLLAARKCRRTTCTDYIISLQADDSSKGNDTYIGKLRSNFLGTKFVVYDALPPNPGAKIGKSWSTRMVGSKQISPRVHAGNYPVAHISYELNVLGARGPRRMHCAMDAITASAIKPNGVAPTQTYLPISCVDSFPTIPFFRTKSNYLDKSLSGPLSNQVDDNNSLVLRNKSPRWHEQLQCWCLNFHGRVTVASVKNFQLVASPENGVAGPEHDKVILQFGKVGKDVFTMDYRYPISAFQAFAICLSSFDTKIACE